MQDTVEGAVQLALLVHLEVEICAVVDVVSACFGVCQPRAIGRAVGQRGGNNYLGEASRSGRQSPKGLVDQS